MEETQTSDTASILRPLTLGELVDRAFNLYRDHFRIFFVIGLLPRAVVWAIALWNSATLYTHIPRLSRSILVALLLQWIITLPVHLIALAVSHAMTMLVVANAYLHRPIELHEAYRRAKPYWGPLFWLALQTTFRVLGGFALFLVPGVLLSLSYAVSVPAAVFEDLKGGEALRRSAHLTEGYRGRIFGLYFLSGLISYTVSAGGAYLVRHMFSFSLFGGRVLVELAAFVVGSVVTPTFLIAFALLYYDLRVRKEAFDLEYMASKIDMAEVARVAEA